MRAGGGPAAFWSPAAGGMVPDTVLADVLEYLAPADVPRASGVCRRWRALTRAVLERIVENGCDLCADCPREARIARAGCLDVLRREAAGREPEWLARLGPAVCRHAAAGGHAAILEWALGHGHPPGAGAPALAARAGDLGLLAWLHARGHAAERWVFLRECREGNLPVVAWLHARGHPADLWAYATARVSGQAATAAWLLARAPPWADGEACVVEDGAGRRHCVTWSA